jgi:hypothetical protein
MSLKYQNVYIVRTQVNVNLNPTYAIYSFNLGLFFNKQYMYNIMYIVLHGS